MQLDDDAAANHVADVNTSDLAEETAATASTQRAREKWDLAIAEACREHEAYLAEYGSLADAVAAESEPEECP